MAKLKQYFGDTIYREYRSRYKQCTRMLNGLEKSLEKQLPESSRKWKSD